MSESILVVGMGEVGGPLYEVVRGNYEAVKIDLEPIDFQGVCAVLHICYPFRENDFLAETARYIEKYDPDLTIVNSTVAPGTTRQIHERTGAPIVHSPVRGKHHKMQNELLRYTKYIGGLEPETSQKAAAHFESLGMKTRILASPEATELAKLTETTYFGLLITWAQEVERYCKQYGLDYDEVSSYYEEIAFFPPVKYFPGVIGGHCILPNLDTLREHVESPLLRAIVWSNSEKIGLAAQQDRKLGRDT